MLFGEFAWSALFVVFEPPDMHYAHPAALLPTIYNYIRYKHEYEAMAQPSDTPSVLTWSNDALPEVLQNAWDINNGPYEMISLGAASSGAPRNNYTSTNTTPTTVYRLFLDFRGLPLVMSDSKLVCQKHNVWGPTSLFQFVPSFVSGHPTVLIRSLSSNVWLRNKGGILVADDTCSKCVGLGQVQEMPNCGRPADKSCHFEVVTVAPSGGGTETGSSEKSNNKASAANLGVALNILSMAGPKGSMLSWGQEAETTPKFRRHANFHKAQISAVVVRPEELKELQGGRHTEELWNPKDGEVIQVTPVPNSPSGFRHKHGGYTGAQYKALLSIKHAVEEMPPTDWLLIGDDDMAIIPPFLHREIALLQSVLDKRGTPSLPIAMGQIACGLVRGTATNLCGGGGMVLSRALVEQLYVSLEQALTLQTARNGPIFMDVGHPHALFTVTLLNDHFFTQPFSMTSRYG